MGKYLATTMRTEICNKYDTKEKTVNQNYWIELMLKRPKHPVPPHHFGQKRKISMAFE
jgi:hypothetical protein